MSVSPLCVVGVSRADEEQPIRGLRGHDDEIEAKDNVVTWRAGGATHKQNPSSPRPYRRRRAGRALTRVLGARAGCTQKSYTLQPGAGNVIEVRAAASRCVPPTMPPKLRG